MQYKCPECSESFSSEHGLKTHIGVNHKVHPECVICDTVIEGVRLSEVEERKVCSSDECLSEYMSKKKTKADSEKQTDEDKRRYHRNYQKRRRDKRLSEAKEQLGGECVNCGSREDLEFDHINPETKEFDIGQDVACVSEERFWKEVEKCQLLCQDCHIEKCYEDGSLNRPEHGERSMYANHGCRCDECTKAQREYMRQYT